MHFVHNETDIIDKTVVEILRHMIKRFDRATHVMYMHIIFFLKIHVKSGIIKES